MVVFGNGLEHGLGELDVSVFIFAVRVSGGVVDRVNVLLESGSLRVGERTGGEIPTAHVDIHAHGLILL